jgi:hypothetical protein
LFCEGREGGQDTGHAGHEVHNAQDTQDTHTRSVRRLVIEPQAPIDLREHGQQRVRDLCVRCFLKTLQINASGALVGYPVPAADTLHTVQCGVKGGLWLGLPYIKYIHVTVQSHHTAHTEARTARTTNQDLMSSSDCLTSLLLGPLLRLLPSSATVTDMVVMAMFFASNIRFRFAPPESVQTGNLQRNPVRVRLKKRGYNPPVI